MSTTRSNEQGPFLTWEAHEAQDALMKACENNAIRDVNECAKLTQLVSFWHRLREDTRQRVQATLTLYTKATNTTIH